jgi:ATP-dependent helicase HrpB
VLPALRDALASGVNALLTASPGAGKTTGVPPALLGAQWLANKKLLLLEPRRLAARAAAHRMAASLGQPVGGIVGYRTRLDTKVGPATRIEVVTEGILSRLLQQDPSLADYGLVIFDEFHERSLQADAGLTLCLETQRLFRPTLRLLVMSATLECGPISELLGDAPVLVCEGRPFPVETRYLDRPLAGRLDAAVVQAIRRSLAQDRGSLLVFLPGMAEIRRVERLLQDAPLDARIRVAPLHGDLPQAAQDEAIAPAEPGTRKVVLATSIAETSLTIDGVRVVIDSGLSRMPRFDPRTGLTRLDTVRVTQDSADQRRGRAGRLESGVCYRLWTEKEQAALAARRLPEILEADLAPLILELAEWGANDPSELRWLTPPPLAAAAQAKDLLARLDALDAAGSITTHGRSMAGLAVHPRLAHMLIKAEALKLTDLACDLAALLGERDIVRAPAGRRQADIRLRLDALWGRERRAGDAPIDHGARQRAKQTADLYRRRLSDTARRHSGAAHDSDASGLLLALAYPDRIAQRQPQAEARYLLANGRGALFANPDPLVSEPYLVIAELDAGVQWARIDLAAPVTPADIEALFNDRIEQIDEVSWDERTQSVRAAGRRRFGALTLSEQALSNPDPAMIAHALSIGLRQAGLSALAWTPELRQWQARIRFLKTVDGPDSHWPDLSDDALLKTMDEWLEPFLVGITTLERVKRMDLAPALQTRLGWDQQRELDRRTPTHLTVPSGSRLRLDYDQPEGPVLAVRLQEMFGCTDTPRVADGKVPVLLHLLSPAKRPVQVTKDLAGFWANTYWDVRKDLRGRYPKHHWPEDPLLAAPTAKAKRPGR